MAIRMLVIRISILVVLPYLLYVLAIYFFQKHLQYFPTHKDRDATGDSRFEPWKTSTGQLVGYVRGGQTIKRSVVMFHGNAGEALDRAWLNALFPSPEIAVVLPEYPGFGAKQGTPNEAQIHKEGVQLLEAVRKRWNAPITLMGESIGTGVASGLATQPGVDRIALISPFYSALDVAKRSFRVVPVSLILKDTYLSNKHLAKVRLPLFIVHGTKDDTIPLESAKRLFNEYQGSTKYFVPMEGISHNDVDSWILAAPEGEQFRSFVRGEI